MRLGEIAEEISRIRADLSEVDVVLVRARFVAIASDDHLPVGMTLEERSIQGENRFVVRSKAVFVVIKVDVFEDPDAERLFR